MTRATRARIAARRRPLAALRRRGVAVITALLLTTLAVTIVASLFWQQQVQVRSMENQRLHLQTKWILRGALDWARLILRQDGADRPNQTVLTGVWATPLAETRLDDYIERERQENEKFDATLSGQVSDAQARFNLTNLATGRKLNPAEVVVFARLLSNLQLNPALAQAAAQEVAKGQPLAPVPEGSNPPAEGTPGALPTGPGKSDGGGEPMEFLQVEDLLSVSGFTPQAVEKLREFVIVLPESTVVNVNTAAPEVLAAVVDFSVSEANALSISRKQAFFLNDGDFTNRLNGRQLVKDAKVGVKSSYFLVDSRVRLDRAELDAQALIQRQSENRMVTTLLSIREY